jgi:CheY-like chemotaxis protein
MNGNLAGQRVFLVEDDSLVASTVGDILSFAGVGSVEVAPTIERALDALARQQFDLAIMDINLNGRTCWPVAVDMRDRGLISGHGYEPNAGELRKLLLVRVVSVKEGSGNAFPGEVLTIIAGQNLVVAFRAARRSHLPEQFPYPRDRQENICANVRF